MYILILSLNNTSYIRLKTVYSLKNRSIPSLKSLIERKLRT